MSTNDFVDPRASYHQVIRTIRSLVQRSRKLVRYFTEIPPLSAMLLEFLHVTDFQLFSSDLQGFCDSNCDNAELDNGMDSIR